MCRLTPFNRTNNIHMTTTVSRRLNTLCIMFKIRAFFISVLFALKCACILRPCGKHLHDRSISLRQEARIHKTSLRPLLFIEMHVPNQGSEWSWITVRLSILPLSPIFRVDFGTVPQMVVLCCCLFCKKTSMT